MVYCVVSHVRAMGRQWVAYPGLVRGEIVALAKQGKCVLSNIEIGLTAHCGIGDDSLQEFNGDWHIIKMGNDDTKLSVNLGIHIGYLLLIFLQLLVLALIPVQLLRGYEIIAQRSSKINNREDKSSRKGMKAAA